MRHPELFSLRVASDALIGLAYLCIPFTLLYFLRKRADLQFNWIFRCFALLILVCGFMHLLEIWTVWYPMYGLTDSIRAVTALASVATAIMLIKFVSTALLLPSPAALTAANMDSTERKRAAEHFRLALEAAPTGMLMLDQTGRIVLVNAQIEILFGYPRAELLGQTIEMLMPERFRVRHPAHRAQFFAAPRMRAVGARMDLFGLRKDGSEIPVEIGLNPLQTADGVLVISSIVDLSRQREVDRIRSEFISTYAK
jgi:PAS domain S-box-containing protein